MAKEVSCSFSHKKVLDAPGPSSSHISLRSLEAYLRYFPVDGGWSEKKAGWGPLLFLSVGPRRWVTAQVEKRGGKVSAKWRCIPNCFPGLGGIKPKTELPGAVSSEAQHQLNLTEGFSNSKGLLNGSTSDGAMKHIMESADGCNGQGEPSTSSSQGAKDGKPGLSAARKHGKRPKY